MRFGNVNFVIEIDYFETVKLEKKVLKNRDTTVFCKQVWKQHNFAEFATAVMPCESHNLMR